jgi:vacuolar-type H+-ATPase subunit I/STV1
MSDDDDWERELEEDDAPLEVDLTGVDAILQEEDKQKQVEEATNGVEKDKDKQSVEIPPPSETDLLAKWNSLEKGQQTQFYMILSSGPTFSSSSSTSSSSKDLAKAREEALKEQREEEARKMANMPPEELRAYERERQEQQDLMAAMDTFGVSEGDIPMSMQPVKATKKVAKKIDPIDALEKHDIKTSVEVTRLALVIAKKFKLLRKPAYVRNFANTILFQCATDVLTGDDLSVIGVVVGTAAKEKKNQEKSDKKIREKLKREEAKKKKEKVAKIDDIFGGGGDDYDEPQLDKKWEKYDDDDMGW